MSNCPEVDYRFGTRARVARDTLGKVFPGIQAYFVEDKAAALDHQQHTSCTILDGELGCSQIEEYSMPLELERVAAEARPIFDRIQPSLLSTDPNAFVAIEPESGEHFVAQTLSEAVEQARERYPERLVHTFRVGHPAAIHFGMQER